MFATRLRAFYNPFIGFLPNLGLAVVLLVGGRQVIDGTLTLGDFTAFYAYLLMLIGPMRKLGIALGLAQRATASGARMFELLDRAAAARRAGRRARRCRPAAAASSCAACSFAYDGARRRSLRDDRPRRAGRHDGRAGRRHRLGQDDARAAARRGSTTSPRARC